ncbi:DNA polymerase IV [Clostridium sp. JN-9]|uniref:DNA polymerase IV n=1 Tax=Clostridium sp. JN-9 TaxID=2507159 RepID=UPI000FFE0C94|nr:DNA polymerase IV [Clostridium sp. JN-9]QAT40707.1 DNA polymerase IV [Clostridium sp. JN-9]
MRSILHMDLNCFFASVEAAENTKLKGKPIAVAGDKESRRGIVLTASYEARAFGVKTTMTVMEAERLCPNLIFIKPHFNKYEEYSNKVMKILRKVTPEIEIFSIDEAWMDITNYVKNNSDAVKIADGIRSTIENSLNITASVGVSYCKVMAKMASDLKKPNATSIIMEDDIKSIIWPMKIRELFGVGKQMEKKLNNIGIFTIGDLACAPLSYIEAAFGKWGRQLWQYANGIDNSKVQIRNSISKGIGNSVTLSKDIKTKEQGLLIIKELSETVSHRLHEESCEGDTIEISIKFNDFGCISRQKKMNFYTNKSEEIYDQASKLFKSHWDEKTPIRLLGVRVTGIKPIGTFKQISLFDESDKKRRQIDKCVKGIRDKFGYNSIKNGSNLKTH